MRLIILAAVMALAAPVFAGDPPSPISRQVKPCWNQGALSTQALRVTVSVRFTLLSDGHVDPATITLWHHDAETQSIAEQAFKTARLAILRCMEDGYEATGPQRLMFGPEGVRPWPSPAPMIEA